MITDGEFTFPALASEEARLTRGAFIDVVAMGIGSWVTRSELSLLASQPVDRNVYQVDDYESLFAVTDQIISTVCDGR